MTELKAGDIVFFHRKLSLKDYCNIIGQNISNAFKTKFLRTHKRTYTNQFKHVALCVEDRQFFETSKFKKAEYKPYTYDELKKSKISILRKNNLNHNNMFDINQSCNYFNGQKYHIILQSSEFKTSYCSSLVQMVLERANIIDKSPNKLPNELYEFLKEQEDWFYFENINVTTGLESSIEKHQNDISIEPSYSITIELNKILEKNLEHSIPLSTDILTTHQF